MNPISACMLGIDHIKSFPTVNWNCHGASFLIGFQTEAFSVIGMGDSWRLVIQSLHYVPSFVCMFNQMRDSELRWSMTPSLVS